MPVFVLIPIFGYIYRVQIRLVLDYRLRIMHTFPGPSNTMNCVDSGFFQYLDPQYIINGLKPPSQSPALLVIADQGPYIIYVDKNDICNLPILTHIGHP